MGIISRNMKTTAFRSVLQYGERAVRPVARKSAVAMAMVMSAALLVCMVPASIESALAADTAEEVDTVYQLDTGDRIKVTVFGHEDLSGEFEVDGTGRVAMPLIQFVEVGGLSVREAESAIEAKLSPDYLKNPKASVEILNYRPFYILGEVENPGSYQYVTGMTVLESVALAGGFTYRARQKKMTVIRAADPEKKKVRALIGTKVLPGDVIEVPERRF